MKLLYTLSALCISLTLISCAQTDPTDGCKPISPVCPPYHTKKNNPLKVSFYRSRPHFPYKVIGQESISKYNSGGNKRQEANIRDGMRELAAAMGGNAVINIKHDAKTITGTVVAIQKNEKSDV